VLCDHHVLQRDLVAEQPSLLETFPILAQLADDFSQVRIVLGLARRA
jgi:hypothetical protein